MNGLKKMDALYDAVVTADALVHENPQLSIRSLFLMAQRLYGDDTELLGLIRAQILQIKTAPKA